MLLPERFIPRAEIEGAASSLLRRARDRELWDGKPAVGVHLISEALLDLSLLWEPLGAVDPNVRLLGALGGTHRTIWLNEDQRDLFAATRGLERFTVAHETGHFCLHIDPASFVQSTLGTEGVKADVLCRDGDRSPREFQAEFFGASLLMPAELVREAVGSTNTSTWAPIYRLRDLFDVSATAMRNRLRECGYPIPRGPDREVRIKIWP